MSDYESLRRQWYQRLAEEGFEDIEHISGGPYLKDFCLPDWQRAATDGREEYFRLAGQFLHEHDWDCEEALDRDIWQRWCELGFDKKRIAQELHTTQKRVLSTIRRLEAQMKAVNGLG